MSTPAPVSDKAYLFPKHDIWAENPAVSLAYKVAVMHYALNHGDENVEVKNNPGLNRGILTNWTNSKSINNAYFNGASTQFDWATYIYRIDPKLRPIAPAPGYNPEQYTDLCVGTADGWRCLELDEVRTPRAISPGSSFAKVVFYYQDGYRKWANLDEIGEAPLGPYRPTAPGGVLHMSLTYRTRLTIEQLARV